MDNLIALSLIHVLAPFMLILLILEVMQPFLLTSCLICFYNYKMDSYSAPTRGDGLALEMASPLALQRVPLAHDAAAFLWSQLGLASPTRYCSSFPVSALALALTRESCQGLWLLSAEWITASFFLEGTSGGPLSGFPLALVYSLWSRWLLLLNNFFSIVWSLLLEVCNCRNYPTPRNLGGIGT